MSDRELEVTSDEEIKIRHLIGESDEVLMNVVSGEIKCLYLVLYIILFKVH